jgi:hypothetical protein
MTQLRAIFTNQEHPWMSDSVERLAENQVATWSPEYLSVIQGSLLQQIVDGRVTEFDNRSGAQLMIINRNQITSMVTAQNIMLVANIMRSGALTINPEIHIQQDTEMQNTDACEPLSEDAADDEGEDQEPTGAIASDYDSEAEVDEEGNQLPAEGEHAEEEQEDIMQDHEIAAEANTLPSDPRIKVSQRRRKA